jgi:hypothetical protein
LTSETQSSGFAIEPPVEQSSGLAIIELQIYAELEL